MVERLSEACRLLDGRISRGADSVRYRMPQVFIAASKAAWLPSESGVMGRRNVGWQRPIRAAAHLTGMGLASIKRFLCSGINASCLAAASLASPASAFGLHTRVPGKVA